MHLGSGEAGADDWLGVADRIEIMRIADVKLKLRKVDCETCVRSRMEGQLSDV